MTQIVRKYRLWTRSPVEKFGNFFREVGEMVVTLIVKLGQEKVVDGPRQDFVTTHVKSPKYDFGITIKCEQIFHGAWFHRVQENIKRDWGEHVWRRSRKFLTI